MEGACNKLQLMARFPTASAPCSPSQELCCDLPAHSRSGACFAELSRPPAVLPLLPSSPQLSSPGGTVTAGTACDPEASPCVAPLAVGEAGGPVLVEVSFLDSLFCELFSLGWSRFSCNRPRSLSAHACQGTPSPAPHPAARGWTPSGRRRRVCAALQRIGPLSGPVDTPLVAR